MPIYSISLLAATLLLFMGVYTKDSIILLLSIFNLVIYYGEKLSATRS